MNGANGAQVASTAFAAASALAALTTVWLARSQSRLARESLEAQTQPLLSDAPRGLFLEEIDWHEVSGEITSRTNDKATISVGTAGEEPVAFASVPIRNVGNGCARISAVAFLLPDGTQTAGRIDNPVLPSGELTHARLDAGPEDDGALVAESIGMEYQDFAVVLEYADAGRRARGAVRLDVANGQYPYVTARRWADGVAELR
ncbi:MAG TPA: hypothetical protein VHU13_04770 [Solirubrobacteraceae bacterium]|jgi:hypothetical protein|nr:hypothetical protein [Solirubrobacteraceae bacterium]